MASKQVKNTIEQVDRIVKKILHSDTFIFYHTIKYNCKHIIIKKLMKKYDIILVLYILYANTPETIFAKNKARGTITNQYPSTVLAHLDWRSNKGALHKTQNLNLNYQQSKKIVAPESGYHLWSIDVTANAHVLELASAGAGMLGSNIGAVMTVGAVDGATGGALASAGVMGGAVIGGAIVAGAAVGAGIGAGVTYTILHKENYATIRAHGNNQFVIQPDKNGAQVKNCPKIAIYPLEINNSQPLNKKNLILPKNRPNELHNNAKQSIVATP